VDYEKQIEYLIIKRKKSMFNLETISPKMLDYYVNQKKAFIIDLRSEDEYSRGHIKGAVSIPYEDGHFSYRPPKGMEIVLYCERGSVSLIVARDLAKLGYRVRSVIGGLHAYRGTNLVR